ncbi:MAG: phosphatase PAP2 family protein [Myxococcales bacterium]|nr:phosphatase PAP2 family protein [Myxococcales bacterium]
MERDVRWAQFRTPLVLAVMLVVVSSGVTFLRVADRVTEAEQPGLDERILQQLRRPDAPSTPRGPAWLVEASRDITALGSLSVLLLLVFGILGYFVLARRWDVVALVLASAAGGAIINQLMKAFFARPRPGVVPHLTDVVSPSFPSGHAMLSTIVYLTLGAVLAELSPRKRLKSFVLGVALILAVLVGLSRVYLGVHYPTDVLAGWSAGLAWALTCWLMVHALRVHGLLHD